MIVAFIYPKRRLEEKKLLTSSTTIGPTIP